MTWAFGSSLGIVSIIGAAAFYLEAQQPASSTQSVAGGVAQSAETHDLRNPSLFESIASVRELRDGRVLVTDQRTMLLYVLDPSLKSRRQIGRSGDGPGEYRSPGPIIALLGDRSAVIDRQNRKLYMLDADKFVELPVPLRPPGATWRGVQSGIADDYSRFAAVAHGSIVRFPFPTPDRTIPVTSDSVAFVLQRPGQGIDTIGYGRSYHWGALSKRVRTGNGWELHNVIHPLQTFDQGWIFSDGNVAIARVSPYRVDWYTSGVMSVGPAVTESPLPVTRSVRKWITDHTRLDVNGEPMFRPDDFAEWPLTLPPFTSFSVSGGIHGRLYVQRTTISERQRIDVFERTRGRIATVELPARSRLVGVGARHWYLAQPNDDDEEVLIRWTPPSR